MTFIVFILAVFLLFFFLEKAIRKWLGIHKVKISDKSYKKKDLTGRILIAVVLLCTLPYALTKDGNVQQLYFIFYLIVLLGFQTYLQWRYLKNSKEYILTLILLFLSVLLLYNIQFFITF
ncbi:DUF4181 domain-containing protein [Peribacillus psychrosaccharolyticus]|uniref:DUF4181 domain-containing protein n=1 Tax=Peribacillus psychrosaccharolyticus TaxID=1407 RepID=UPI003D2CB053